MKLDSNSLVYRTENDWLFLIGGSNNVLDIFKGKYRSASWIEGWAGLIEERAKIAIESGVEYCHLAAPEKMSVYSRYLGSAIRSSIDFENAPSSCIERNLSEGFRKFYVNPTAFLRQQSEEYKVYHATDTHWSFLGAYSAYQLLMNRLGYSVDNSISLDVTPKGECVMDLGGKLTPAVAEKVFFYEPRDCVRRIYANDLVQYKEQAGKQNEPGLHTGSVVQFNNDEALYKKRVLLFGDSFSEYRPQLLTGLLAETFQEVMFVWGLNVDYKLVERFTPDILVTETAERFMPFTVPRDNVDYEELVEDLLKKK